MFSMSLLFLVYCNNHVFAAEYEPYIAEMNNTIWSWFLQIRNHIAPPLLALSFAICGMRILGASFQNKGAQVIDTVKSQLFMSSIALVVLIALPAIMSAAKDIFASGAWTPPETNVAIPVIEPTKNISETFAETTAVAQP